MRKIDMSYSMTHLIIANRFAKERNIVNKDIFLLANIAPDAVHSKKDFSFELKALSHQLQENEKWGQIWTQEAINIWYERLRKFYRKTIQHAEIDKERDFLMGYTLHILVDIFNCKLIYGPQLVKYNFDVENMRDEYRRECIGQDNYLYQNYEDTPEIMHALDRALEQDITDVLLENLELDKYITVRDIVESVTFFKNAYGMAESVEMKDYKMMSEESTREFLDEVSIEVNRLLYTFPKFEDTFRY